MNQTWIRFPIYFPVTLYIQSLLYLVSHSYLLHLASTFREFTRRRTRALPRRSIVHPDPSLSQRPRVRYRTEGTQGGNARARSSSALLLLLLLHLSRNSPREGGSFLIDAKFSPGISRAGRDIGRRNAPSALPKKCTPGDGVIRSSGNIRQSGDRAASAGAPRTPFPSSPPFLLPRSPFYPRAPGRIHRHPGLSRSDLSDCLSAD